MLKSVFIPIFLCASIALASSPFKNSDLIKSIYGFNQIYQKKTQKPLRVAVLDKGFEGYSTEIGKSLPQKTVYMAGPVAAPADMKVEHGFRMAQILSDLMTDSGQDSSAIAELRLYNVYGFSNFKAAIADIIKNKIDLVLYSEVWEFGNNFDGRGFINAEVKKAIDAGIIWVNASGNFAQTTFNSKIQAGEENWLEFPDQNRSLALVCKENTQNKCFVKVVLSWNDFRDQEDYGTDKDLDLALTDDLLGIIQTSRLKQTKAPDIRPGETKYPREILTAELKPGTYFIRVKKVSDNFSSKDRLRITVDGENLHMPSAQAEESLLNPADLRGVISVGAWDSDRSGVSLRLKKPDVWALSSVILPDNTEFRGSSNAAAITAAALGLLKSKNPKLKSAQLLRNASFDTRWQQGPLSLRDLGFQPQAGQCFKEVFPQSLPAHIQEGMARGAKLVETNYGLRLMVPYDPIELGNRLRRQFANDLVLLTPTGVRVQTRQSPTGPEDIEVFQIPRDMGPCNLPQQNLRFLAL